MNAINSLLNNSSGPRRAVVIGKIENGFAAEISVEDGDIIGEGPTVAAALEALEKEVADFLADHGE